MRAPQQRPKRGATGMQGCYGVPISHRKCKPSHEEWQASCVSNSHKSVTNRSLPACKRLEARAELEPLGAKTPYQIPAQGMVCPVPLFDMATWVQRHRARGVPPSCYTERAPAAVHHKTLPRPDTEELSGPVGPLSVTRTGRCPVLDPYSR